MCVINRDNQVIVTDRSEEIASLQAELAKKDQEIKELDDHLKDHCEVYNHDIDELEQKLEGQKAYIHELEAAYLKAEFWDLWHTGKYDDVEKANKKAEEALEKLKRG